jgi:hypothetical protein
LIETLKHPTNATKAQILAAVNALIVLVTAFGLELSADQIGAITLTVNALFSAYIGLTYKQSPKRVAEGLNERMEKLG